MFALESHRIFGGKTPNWEKWAAEPINIHELIALYPEKDPLWQALKDAGYNSLQELLKRFMDDNALPENFMDKYTDAEKQKKLIQRLRVLWMYKKYHIKPQMALEIHKKYGELEWRLPESHAIYWAHIGLSKAPDKKDAHCQRVIIYSLNQAFERGHLLAIDDSKRPDFFFAPNFNVADAIYELQWSGYKTYDANSFFIGLENFFKAAMMRMYLYGHNDKAVDYYNKMHKIVKDKLYFFSDHRILKMPPKVYFKAVLNDYIDKGNMSKANAMVEGLFMTALRHLLGGDVDTARSLDKQATAIYHRYQKKNALLKRELLPPLQKLKQNIVKRVYDNLPEKHKKHFAEVVLTEAAQNRQEQEKKAEEKFKTDFSVSK